MTRVVTLLALVVACAGPEARAVTIQGLAFHPGDLTAAAGDTIVWTNEDIVPHTVTFSGQTDSDEVPAGGALTFVVPARGDTLAYFCRYHPVMQGRIVVR